MGFAGRVALNCPCSQRSSNAAASAIANRPESGWNCTRQVHRFLKWVGVSQNEISISPYIPTTFPPSNGGLLHLLLKIHEMLDIIQQLFRSRCKTHQAVDDDLKKRWKWWLTSDYMSQERTYATTMNDQWSFRIYRSNLNTCPYLSQNRTLTTHLEKKNGLGTLLRSHRRFRGWGPQPTDIPPRCSLRTDVSCLLRPEKLQLTQHSTRMKRTQISAHLFTKSSLLRSCVNLFWI